MLADRELYSTLCVRLGLDRAYACPNVAASRTGVRARQRRCAVGKKNTVEENGVTVCACLCMSM